MTKGKGVTKLVSSDAPVGTFAAGGKNNFVPVPNTAGVIVVRQIDNILVVIDIESICLRHVLDHRYKVVVVYPVATIRMKCRMVEGIPSKNIPIRSKCTREVYLTISAFIEKRVYGTGFECVPRRGEYHCSSLV